MSAKDHPDSEWPVGFPNPAASLVFLGTPGQASDHTKQSHSARGPPTRHSPAEPRAQVGQGRDRLYPEGQALSTHLPTTNADHRRPTLPGPAPTRKSALPQHSTLEARSAAGSPMGL